MRRRGRTSTCLRAAARAMSRAGSTRTSDWPWSSSCFDAMKLAVDPGVELGVSSPKSVHPITYAMSSSLPLETRSTLSVPTSRRIEARTIANASNRPSKSFACPTGARAMMLAETSVRKIAMRTSSSFWVVPLACRQRNPASTTATVSASPGDDGCVEGPPGPSTVRSFLEVLVDDGAPAGDRALRHGRPAAEAAPARPEHHRDEHADDPDDEQDVADRVDVEAGRRHVHCEREHCADCDQDQADTDSHQGLL